MLYLCDGCPNEAVVEACDKQFVQYARRSAIVCDFVSITVAPWSRSGARDIHMDTVIDPPSATQALSIVSANPQILKSPYCRCSWSLCPDAFTTSPRSLSTRLLASTISLPLCGSIFSSESVACSSDWSMAAMTAIVVPSTDYLRTLSGTAQYTKRDDKYWMQSRRLAKADAQRVMESLCGVQKLSCLCDDSPGLPNPASIMHILSQSYQTLRYLRYGMLVIVQCSMLRIVEDKGCGSDR